MKKEITIIIILILLFPQASFSQISYETSKAVLIYQFAKNINNPNYKNLKNYKIAFLGNDIATFNELQKITKTNKIKNTNVELSRVKNINQIKNINLLYLDKTWSKKIEDVWMKIKGKNILLISEQCTESKYIMLNILFDKQEKKVSFEINKANLIIEQFEFDSEILLLGGKEIDIRELYLDMKKQLELKKNELENQKQIAKNKSIEIKKLHKNADSLSKEIDKQISKISTSEHKLGKLSKNINVQQKKLSQKYAQIESQEATLLKQKEQITKKEKRIRETSEQLKLLILEKNEHEYIIREQQGTLSNKENIIKTKNRQLYLSVALAFLLFVLVSVTLYAFYIKRNTNKKIKSQNKKLEIAFQKLKQTQYKLIQSEKMASLGILTAGIAHEINNPINYIHSGIEGLKTINRELIKTVKKYIKINDKTNTDEQQNLNDNFNFLIGGTKKLTKNIQTGANKASEIVKSLSIYSRTEESELSLNDIHENINSAIILLHNKLKNKIEIIKKFNKIPKIYCYPGKLNQIFINIILNAIQAIEEEGIIEITTMFLRKNETTEIDNDCIFISFKDTGSGIPDKFINNIFEPFFTTKEAGEGTGLGLSITYEIIKLHKGKIIAKKNKIKGTEFRIFIPALINKDQN